MTDAEKEAFLAELTALCRKHRVGVWGSEKLFIWPLAEVERGLTYVMRKCADVCHGIFEEIDIEW